MGNFWYKSKVVSKVFEPTLAEIVHKTGFLDPEKCASKSSEKSEFFRRQL